MDAACPGPAAGELRARCRAQNGALRESAPAGSRNRSARQTTRSRARGGVWIAALGHASASAAECAKATARRFFAPFFRQARVSQPRHRHRAAPAVSRPSRIAFEPRPDRQAPRDRQQITQSRIDVLALEARASCRRHRPTPGTAAVPRLARVERSLRMVQASGARRPATTRSSAAARGAHPCRTRSSFRIAKS
jgi:hypothetical protein